MLDATSQTAIEFCRQHGYAYESYVGVKRGFHPWQAAFNRIFQLQDLLQRRPSGWALYMDADAFIYDLAFDLSAYLSDKVDKLAVMATIPGATQPWHINSGVLMLNLGHPLAGKLVGEWMKLFMAYSEEWLRTQTSMDPTRDNDQIMLFNILDTDIDLRAEIHFESGSLMNLPDSSFIRQYLTAFTPGLAERTLIIEGMVEAILGKMNSESLAGQLALPILNALYRATLGRNADPAGRATYVPVIQELGPDYGTERILHLLLNCEEYHARKAM